jgi:hypothetical protein
MISDAESYIFRHETQDIGNMQYLFTPVNKHARFTHLSIAITSALLKSPAVKIVPPLLPLPFSSGRSPFADLRIAKNREGTDMLNKLSCTDFMGTSVVNPSEA